MRIDRFFRCARGIGPAAVVLAVFWAVTVSAEPTETKILPSDGGLGDRFGDVVCLSGDYGVFGAQGDDDGGGDAGAVYVYDMTMPEQLRKLHALDAQGGAYFGVSLAVHGDIAVIGALRDDHVAVDAGSAYLFDITDGSQLHKLTASDAAANDWFGNAVAISPSYALVGSYKYDLSASVYDCGSAYLYDAATGEQLFKLMASDAGRQDWFGYAVAVSEEYAVVGAPTWDGIGVQGNCGAVYVYDTQTGEELWKLTTTDEGQEDRFGNALAIQGDFLLAGAYWNSDSLGGATGAAYVFDLTTGEQLREIKASEPEGGGDWFGTSVALSGDYALIGACQQGYGTELEGFACLFDFHTGTELAKFTASDGGLDDQFGISVALQADRALIGSDQNDDQGINSGSAYLYESFMPSTGVAEAVPVRRLTVANRPNPFNPCTEISLTLPAEATVELGIYDARGRLVRTLVAGEPRPAGETRMTWDGVRDDGVASPSGVYFYRAIAGDLHAKGKMVLVR